MKIKAVVQNNVATVKMLIQHPMETGRSKDQDGTLIPAHFITEVTATCNDVTVFYAQLGTGVSKNPYLSFRFEGANGGDTVKVSWTDNKGESDMAEAAIKAL